MAPRISLRCLGTAFHYRKIFIGLGAAERWPLSIQRSRFFGPSV